MKLDISPIEQARGGTCHAPDTTTHEREHLTLLFRSFLLFPFDKSFLFLCVVHSSVFLSFGLLGVIYSGYSSECFCPRVVVVVFCDVLTLEKRRNLVPRRSLRSLFFSSINDFICNIAAMMFSPHIALIHFLSPISFFSRQSISDPFEDKALYRRLYVIPGL